MPEKASSKLITWWRTIVNQKNGGSTWPFTLGAPRHLEQLATRLLRSLTRTPRLSSQPRARRFWKNFQPRTSWRLPNQPGLCRRYHQRASTILQRQSSLGPNHHQRVWKSSMKHGCIDTRHQSVYLSVLHSNKRSCCVGFLRGFIPRTLVTHKQCMWKNLECIKWTTWRQTHYNHFFQLIILVVAMDTGLHIFIPIIIL